MDSKVTALISLARQKMLTSNDPIHDLSHVERVVAMAQTLAEELNIDRKHTQALLLAAWWHDVSRTLTKRPSFIYMLLLDDLISALLLWYHTVRLGLFGSVAGMATRLIFCSNLSTGKLFVRFFLRARTRILLDLLQDADNIDVLHPRRLSSIQHIIDGDDTYRFAYRILSWFNFNTNCIVSKTAVGRKHLRRRVRDFQYWIETHDATRWHEHHFGVTWVRNTKRSIHAFVKSI